MSLGAAIAGLTDVQFSIPGYFWVMTCAVSTALYLLFIDKLGRESGLNDFGDMAVTPAPCDARSLMHACTRACACMRGKQCRFHSISSGNIHILAFPLLKPKPSTRPSLLQQPPGFSLYVWFSDRLWRAHSRSRLPSSTRPCLPDLFHRTPAVPPSIVIFALCLCWQASTWNAKG
jgi:hypothetical protein